MSLDRWCFLFTKEGELPIGWAFPSASEASPAWVMLDAEASPQRLLLGWG